MPRRLRRKSSSHNPIDDEEEARHECPESKDDEGDKKWCTHKCNPASVTGPLSTAFITTGEMGVIMCFVWLSSIYFTRGDACPSPPASHIAGSPGGNLGNQ